MIREATPSDIEPMVALWLRASQKAHSFIPPEYWSAHASAMREQYLPGSETYVDAVAADIRGFISLVGDDLAALFVDPASQSQGIGSRLLSHAQSIRSTLKLTVYVENERATGFYRHHGFHVIDTRLDAGTGRQEAIMEWCASTV